MSQPQILFVCWGNVCRSPMAAVVAAARAVEESVPGVSFTSAGVSDEEAGHPMDPRAVSCLTDAGYRPGPHTAHKVTHDEVMAADLVIGMEELHLSRIRQLAPDAGHLYLLTDFDPDAVPGSEIPDPWYGDASDFVAALKAIEAAIPEVVKRAAELNNS